MSSNALALLPFEVADAFLTACHDELSALKPGNVHIHADGHDMSVADFDASAEAAAPAISNPELSVGERIEQAVSASFNRIGCNTNLGIILLAAPLAQAVLNSVVNLAAADGKNLQARLTHVLSDLTVEDADRTFSAIRMANPGGLGTVSQQDVHFPAKVTLLEAMRAASHRDRIANAYISDFDEIFQFGQTTFAAAMQHARTRPLAITTLHMNFLAKFPDSHIVRKFGYKSAEQVRKAAETHRACWHPAATNASYETLITLDRQLKSEGLNPGTTADFVVATLFADTLAKKLAQTEDH